MTDFALYKVHLHYLIVPLHLGCCPASTFFNFDPIIRLPPTGFLPCCLPKTPKPRHSPASKGRLALLSIFYIYYTKYFFVGFNGGAVEWHYDAADPAATMNCYWDVFG